MESNDLTFKKFEFFGKRMIEYYIYIMKLDDINYQCAFSERELKAWTIAFFHLVNDLCTDDDQNDLPQEEIEKKISELTDEEIKEKLTLRFD